MAAPFPILCAAFALSTFCNEPAKTEQTYTPPIPLNQELQTIPAAEEEQLLPGKLTLRPKNVDFGAIVENKPASLKKVILQNTGQTALSIGRIRYPVSSVETHDDCPPQLAPNQACTLSLGLLTNRPGLVQDTVKIETLDGNTHLVNLSANIMPKPQKTGLPGKLDVRPKTIDFGSVSQHGPVVQKTITLQNTGELPVSIGQIGYPHDLVEAKDNCPPQLGANQFCTITLGLFNETPGMVQGTLEISPLNGEIQRVALLARVKAKTAKKTGPSRDDLLRQLAKAARYQKGEDSLLKKASLTTSGHTPSAATPAGYWKMKDKDYSSLGIAKTEVSLPVDRCRTITEDAYIDASLENSVNSMIGGRVIAVVSYPVFASNCDRILIPSGTTVVGEYEPLQDNSITRLEIKWRRLILPDGSSVVFDFDSADVEGKNALQGEIDSRDKEKFARIFAFSAINLGMNVAASYFQQHSASTGQAVAQINTDTSSQIGEVTAAIAQQQLNIKNVLRLPKRMEIKIIPNKDLWFPEVEYVMGVK